MNLIAKLTTGMLLLLGIASVAAAQINLDISKTAASDRIPVAISPFSGGAPEDIAAIIAADLQRTGKIQPQPPQARADYAVVGQASAGGTRGWGRSHLRPSFQWPRRPA